MSSFQPKLEQFPQEEAENTKEQPHPETYNFPINKEPYPTSLFDPVTQPPIAEGGAAHIQHEKGYDDQESQGAPRGLDIDTIH